MLYWCATQAAWLSLFSKVKHSQLRSSFPQAPSARCGAGIWNLQSTSSLQMMSALQEMPHVMKSGDARLRSAGSVMKSDESTFPRTWV